MPGHWPKINPSQAELIAYLKARRARGIAAGKPFAIAAQAAEQRAEAEQRELDRRERDRLRRLLDLDKKVEQVCDPNRLLTARQAAARLNITIEQLTAHADDGALRYYINVGRGEKRPRRRFDPTDLDAFKTARTTMEHRPCPSSSLRNRPRTTGTASKSNVVGFTAARAARLAKRQNGSKR